MRTRTLQRLAAYCAVVGLLVGILARWDACKRTCVSGLQYVGWMEPDKEPEPPVAPTVETPEVNVTVQMPEFQIREWLDSPYYEPRKPDWLTSDSTTPVTQASQEEEEEVSSNSVTYHISDDTEPWYQIFRYPPEPRMYLPPGHAWSNGEFVPVQEPVPLPWHQTPPILVDGLWLYKWPDGQWKAEEPPVHYRITDMPKGLVN